MINNKPILYIIREWESNKKIFKDPKTIVIFYAVILVTKV